MPSVLCTARTKSDDCFEIVFDPSSRSPFTLDCGWTRQGSKQFIELPRMYRTARGARQAAALLAGESLDWKEPVPSELSKPE